MLVVNLSVAWCGDFRSRAAAVDLGRWVQTHYGPAARLYGPDGITQVVNHYAPGPCESFYETAPLAKVAWRIGRFRPDVILLSTDRRGPPADKLPDCVAALGFEPADWSCLPSGCENLRVLVRHAGGGRLVQGGTQSNNLVDSALTMHEARCPPPATVKGDKPRS
jgi:hypothetical protein